MALNAGALLVCLVVFLHVAANAHGFPYTFSYMQPSGGQRSYDFMKDEAPSSSTTFPPTDNVPPSSDNTNFPGSQGGFIGGGSASPIVENPASSTPPSPTTTTSSPVLGTSSPSPSTGTGTGTGTGSGTHVGGQTTSGGKVWCIAKPSVDEVTLMGNIVYACGDGGVNCGAIQPGGACYKPNTLTAHASYVMNLYYQRNQRNWWTCHFNNTGLVVFTDPSYGDCLYSPQ